MPEADATDPARRFEAPFDDPRYNGNRLLCRSPNFTVRSEWEVVFLEGRELTQRAVIGDFYGDPAEAAIDATERWCVTVGCGLIAYRLTPPWRPWDGRVDDLGQWWGHGQDPPEPLWLKHVRAIDDRFVCDTNPTDEWLIQRFDVRPDERSILLVEQWTDHDARFRNEVLHRFVGQALIDVAFDGAALTFTFAETGADTLTFTGEWMYGARAKPWSHVDPHKLATSGVVDALRGFLPSHVKQLDSGDAGELTFVLALSSDAVPTETAYVDIHVSGDQARGAWSARSPIGEVVSPGAAGWPTRPV
jgi:hypothetical protein